MQNVDPSIVTAALGIGPGELMDDLTAFGLYFETMAVRDLRTYAEALGGSLCHYHDRGGRVEKVEGGESVEEVEMSFVIMKKCRRRTIDRGGEM